MSESYKERLKNITTFVFDVDGVLTNGDVILEPSGDMLRTMSTRDGYAIQYAVKKGYNICIISGGNSQMVKTRMNYLGVQDVFLGSSNKVPVFDKYLADKDLKSSEILYMGDDIPDYPVLKKVGIATCPHDAAPEVREICHYISHLNGGKGCVRDVIEQVLRAKNDWFHSDAHHW
jgi:3-deoxy-D-manno-octulosonate 8-phosphate phosphatase (KDO 8-P phosphatase)